MSAERTCGICTNDYGGKVVPTILTCCLNHVCFGCAESHRAEKISGLTGNKKKIGCMWCNQLFHSSKETPWKVNKPFINSHGIEVDMSAVKEAQAAMHNSTASKKSSGNFRRSMQVAEEKEDESEEEEGVNNSSMVSTPVDSHISEHQSSSTSMATAIRRSQRIIQREGVEACDSEEDSRFSTQTDDDNEEQNEGNNINEETDASIINDTRARKRTRRTNGNMTVLTLPSSSEDTQSPSGIQYPAESAVNLDEDSFVQDGDAKIWMNAMSNKNLNVYRIRCYNTASITNEDQHARKCSQWCVNNGYTVTCLELAKLLPDDQRHDGEALKTKILSIDSDRLREECRLSQDFDYNVEGRYILSYRQFIEMKQGDIVVLHTSGSKGTASHPPQTLTFGVIQDESLTLMHKEEAIQKHGFPWDFCDPGAVTTDRIGIMVRKVKWYRQGELRAVRGAAQVSWLAECQSIWMGKVGVKTTKFLKQAISKMSSKKFLQNTHAINNKWSMD